MTAGETAPDFAPVMLRKAPEPDFHRFADAIRSRPTASLLEADNPRHEVPLEKALQEPHVGRHHTNGCFGARYDLRKKGQLVDCAQCDRALTHAEAAACRSPFCKAGKAALAKRVGFA